VTRPINRSLTIHFGALRILFCDLNSDVGGSGQDYISVRDRTILMPDLTDVTHKSSLTIIVDGQKKKKEK
jgi:hypothetical protein